MSEELAEVHCQVFQDAASDYLDGILVNRRAAELERHARLCPECSQFLEELKETVNLLGDLRSDSVSETSERSAVDAFRQTCVQVSSSKRGSEQTRMLLLWEELTSSRTEDRLPRITNEMQFQSTEFALWLLNKAEETVTTDPRQALLPAEASVEVAQVMAASGRQWDLLASCWAGLAIARTAVSDLKGAKAALAQARVSYGRSEHLPLTRGRVLSATSWVAHRLGELTQASLASQSACESFEAAGDRYRTLCSKITLGAVLTTAGRTSDAIRTLTDALTMVNEEIDPPRHLFAAQMNLSLVYCEVGEPEEAQRLLPGMKRLACEIGGDAPIHLRWLEGTVARVQGEWQSALEIFFEVRSHFERRRECLHYLESSLDALRVHLATENWTPITQLAIETSRVCRDLTQEPEILQPLATLERSALEKKLSELQIIMIGKLIRGRLRSSWVS